MLSAYALAELLRKLQAAAPGVRWTFDYDDGGRDGWTPRGLAWTECGFATECHLNPDGMTQFAEITSIKGQPCHLVLSWEEPVTAGQAIAEAWRHAQSCHPETWPLCPGDANIGIDPHRVPPGIEWPPRQPVCESCRRTADAVCNNSI